MYVLRNAEAVRETIVTVEEAISITYLCVQVRKRV
jgi:hypothetical protein